jgi:phenylpropionate dioxygenase-like ring-hydroxylating dioxygenase large terminal subunit
MRFAIVRIIDMQSPPMFLKNTWYVAAWSHEVDSSRPFGRTIAGVSVVLWRDEDGQVIGLENRCCHRGAPLSSGRREGNAIRCMYHGMLFDRGGKCIEIPSQEHISPAARVRAFKVVERFKWIWIWMGSPELADSSLIPDTHYLDDPAWKGAPGYMHYDANYLLIADNLLDFSHLAFVHENTLGGSAKYARSRPSVIRIPRGVRVERWLLDDEPAPFLRQIRDWPGHVDRWNKYDFVLPGVLLMDSGSAPTGSGAQEGNRHDAVEFFGCQAITPETAGTSHYFFQQSHNFSLDKPEVTESLRQSVIAGFLEDKEMITAQQRVLELDPDFKMLGMRMDTALSIFRDLVEKTLKGEQRDGSAKPEVAIAE